MASSNNNYTLPSHLDGDDARLNLQHDVFGLILGNKLLKSPVHKDFAGRVLDIGTGTGVWASEFAAAYPRSSAVGIDLYAPSITPVPENCTFRVLDAETSNWDLELENKFDIIHGRMFLFLLKDPNAMLDRCLNALQPGGTIEFQEMQHPYQTDDLTLAAQDTPTLRFARLHVEAAARCGYDRTVACRLPDALKHVGFHDVKVAHYKVPIGPWMESADMKLAGEKYMQCLRWGMLGFSRKVFTEGLGWTEQQVVEACLEVAYDLGNGKVYAPVIVVTGRKAGAEEYWVNDKNSPSV
ncbi:sam dependent methyltransferase [Podospora didyma]|uniref:Sam dependent methyltransferase n=1 Tax=Podospora didyma TaxID=330526 RepID=A0AAE0P5Y8_9PEZI|nr:sam dependent methyltransferase [Podospora didyma]